MWPVRSQLKVRVVFSDVKTGHVGPSTILKAEVCVPYTFSTVKFRCSEKTAAYQLNRPIKLLNNELLS